MKRLCLPLVAAFLLAAPAVAEDAKKQERFAVDVGGGFATYSSLIALSIDMQNWDSSDGVDEPADETHPELNYVVGSLGARYIFTPNIEAGIAASYEYYSSFAQNCPEGKVPDSECSRGDFLDHHLVHIALEGKFNWFTLFDILRPYSRIGIGTMLEFDSGLESVSLPSVQLTPVGLEFLFPYVSVYAELGAGYRGFMSGGIAFRI